MISYKHIADSIKFYGHLDYEFIDVPWAVSQETIEMTAPAWLDTDKLVMPLLDGKCLVGSAEQSFIQLALDGVIESGTYCAATPCFRDEVVDEYHHNYFMKVELIHLRPKSTIDAMDEMIDQAMSFFGGWVDTEVVRTTDKLSKVSFDIIANGIELGSYGIRKVNGISWVYGTGCAEPRFSQVIALNKHS